MDILKLLNELEANFEGNLSFLGFTHIDRDVILDLTNKIRASLPDEVKKASRVTAESEQIVDGAREAATQTLEEAQAESDQISREARASAERLGARCGSAGEQNEAGSRSIVYPDSE